MNEKELLTKKFMLVNMKEISISTAEKPIIGTQGLASCIGFVLHNKEHKRAIVGHVSLEQLLNDSALYDMWIEIYAILAENKLLNVSFDLILIEGAYESEHLQYSDQLEILKKSEKYEYHSIEVLEANLKNIPFIRIDSIKKDGFSVNDIQTDKSADLSKQFAFDANSGEFVTDKVYFGAEYYRINECYTK